METRAVEVVDAPIPKRRLLRRVLAGVAVGVGLLATLAAVLYGFGGMEPPSVEARAVYQRLVEAGEAPAIEERFHIPIPGCVCHSDDPGLQVQHEYLYIRDCKGCHTR
ncbi:MAG TPA: hypothetical protein VF902_03525 [Coriobacteriia bacterium]